MKISIYIGCTSNPNNKHLLMIILDQYNTNVIAEYCH